MWRRRPRRACRSAGQTTLSMLSQEDMMAVTGIGGVFFRAKDPDALSRWYGTHFGVTMVGYEPWRQAAGPTVFMPFSSTTDHWPDSRQWMINFRVSDLDDLLAKLRAADIVVETNPSWDTPETGRFARIQDPEGNPIELWEPPVD
jgi:predicted enzyme related to lactoylglutathione lyase